MKVEVLHDVAVSPNVKPDQKHDCCAFGKMSRLEDEGIHVVYRRGETKHSYDGIIAGQMSTDNGLTWSEPVTIFDGLEKSPPESCVSGSVHVAGDGSLVATLVTLIATAKDSYLFSEEGLAQQRHYYKTHSYDGGNTWTQPDMITDLNEPHMGFGWPGFLAKNGQMFIGGGYASKKTGARIYYGVFSDDNGKTLGPPIDMVTDPSGKLNYDDPYFAVFGDGEIVALFWTYTLDDEETVEVHRCVSNDHGHSWSKPEPVGMLGQLSVPLALDDNKMLVASNFRQRPDGVRLWLSHDRGLTYEEPIQMWDEEQGKIIGQSIESLAPQTRNEGVWEALDRFTFGTPDLMALDDGTFLLSYYSTIDEIIHMRVCRFKLI